MRIAAGQRRRVGQRHVGQQLDRSLAGRRPVEPVEPRHLCDLGAESHGGVEGGDRLLLHQGEPLDAPAAEGPTVEGEDVDAVDAHRPGDDPPVRRQVVSEGVGPRKLDPTSRQSSPVAPPSSGPPSASPPGPTDRAGAAAAVDWVAVAGRVAGELAATAVARDRAGVAPVGEVDRLRRAGLLTLLVPAEHGGPGVGWPVAHAVIRAVGAADASLGHLLGYHQLQLWRVGLTGDAARRHRLEGATVAHGWFWAGASNPRESPLRLTPAPGGFRLHGRKGFATGARLADRLIVSAVRDDTGAKVTFALDGAARGITHLDDWDNMGQRSSASGSVEFDDVPVDADDVLAEQPAADDASTSPRLTLPQLGFQLVLSHLHVAIAEGALAAAGEYTRTATRPWPAGGATAATDDHHVLAAYGVLVARTAAAGALADRATEAFAAADARGGDLGTAERGRLAVTIAAAKVVSTEVVLDVTTRVVELTGARSTGARHGFDRFWRDARTLTVHDPVSYKAEEVGAHHLTGALPAVTGYS